MKKPFYVLFWANIVLVLLSPYLLPARCAIHFGRGGLADGWGPREIHMVLMLGVQCMLFAAMWLSARIMFIVPARWVNLPNKEHWLKPEMRYLVKQKMDYYMSSLGVAIFAFLLFVNVLVIRANHVTPARLSEPLMIGALVVLGAYMVFWTVSFMRAFDLRHLPAQSQ